jgi:Na+/H+ antiporter NhaD/arsenite permease-like protein
VTYLFAIAKNNGTVDLIVRAAVRAVGGRVALIPWVMFGVTALLTAIGAASPAACAIIGPIALGFAGRYKINPLMMGMFVVHGAQAGGFSPISIYGVITNSVMKENKLPVDEMTIFLSSLFFNLAIAVVLFFVLGGRELSSRRISNDEREELDAEFPSGGTSPSSPQGGVMTQTRGTGTGTGTGVAQKVGVDQVVTLVAFIAVAVVSLAFDRNIGFTAITAAVLLACLFPSAQKNAVQQLAWSTVLLVAGVSTFATILSTAGTPEYVGNWAAGFSTAFDRGAVVQARADH